MNNQSQVTTELRPDVAEINGVIKTTSLKVAEFFGKRHCDVIRAIRNLDCSIDFTKRNFAECQRINELANGKPEIYYEMTKNGFIFLAMGFTGKEAAKWKESYINAFDQLEAQLQQLQKPQYGLKSLTSPFISEAEAAQFIKSLNEKGAGDRKEYTRLHRTIKDHYGITTYKNIPAGKLAEAARILGMKLLDLKKQAIPAEPLKLEFTPEELEDLVAERIKSVAGEIMPKQHEEEAVQHNSVTINLAPLVNGRHRRWLVTQALDEMTIMQSIRPDQDLRSRTEVLIDVGASKDALKELITQHVPDELLLHMINLASERLGNHIQYLKINSAVAA
jgi:Rha family phage regulatory protein